MNKTKILIILILIGHSLCQYNNFKDIKYQWQSYDNNQVEFRRDINKEIESLDVEDNKN